MHHNLTNHFEIKNIPPNLEVIGAHVKKAERKNTREYFKIVNGMVRRLNDNGIGGGIAKRKWREKGWDILIPVQDTRKFQPFVDDITLENQLEIDCSKEENLGQLERLVKPAINSKLRDDHLRIANKHVSKSDIFKEDEAKNAYKVRTHIIPESNTIAVKVNKTHKMMYPLKDHQIKKVKEGSEQDCRVIPNWSEGKIVSAPDMKADDCIPDSDKTFVKFWKERYGLSVDPDDQILEVRFGEGKSFNYPSSALFQEFSFDLRKNRRLSLPPYRRLRKAIDFIKKNLRRIDVGPIRLEMDDEPLGSEELGWEEIRLEDSRKIKVRLKENNNDDIECQIKGVKRSLLNGNIPVNGKKNQDLIVFVPKGFNEKEDFVNTISNQYSKLNLGELSLSEECNEGSFYICGRRLDSYKRKAELAHRETIDEEEKPIAIVVAPEGSSKDFFYDVRSVLHCPNTVFDQNPIPVQYIEEKTAIDIVRKNQSYEKNNVVSQLYVKGSPLSPEKALWTLSKHADRYINPNSGTTCYASFDTSRHTELGTGASAYSSVSDSRGEYVISGTSKFSGEKLTPKGFYKIIMDIIMKVSSRRENFERLVIFRDGRDEESDMMKRVIDNGIEGEKRNFPPLEEYLERNELLPDNLILDVIFVNKSPIDRIFHRNKKVKNVHPGLFFRKTSETGLLFSAGSRKDGTVKPLELTFGLRRVVGKEAEYREPSIEEFANEYYRLTFRDILTHQI